MIKKVKKRQSNFELMRIISMFMIIVWHIIIHGHLIDNTSGAINLLLNLILCICIVHVNSFVILTGYFQCDQSFSLKKFLKIFNLQWFYKIIIVIILSAFGIISISNIEFIREILPIGSTHNYWFINCYLVLYLISPFLNKFIKAMNQKEYRKCLLLNFFLFSIIAYITNNATVDNNGSTIIQFVFLYLLGAYFYKYPLKENLHFKNYSKEKRQLILLFGYIFFTFINFLILSFSMYLQEFNNDILKTISISILNSRYGYSSPVIIMQTICYFLYFETLSLKNSIINKVSSTTMGIYLIHDNMYIRTWIYKFLKIDIGSYIISKKYLIYLFIVAIIIFCCCSIIEAIRNKAASFLNNRKIAKKLQDKFYHYIASI